MKFFPLIWSNLKRRKVRTILTVLVIMVGFFLFGYLAAIRNPNPELEPAQPAQPGDDLLGGQHGRGAPAERGHPDLQRLAQLRRVREGNQIEEDHMRNRQMIVRWLMANSKAIEVRQRDGKTYYLMTDPKAFTEGVGRLLAEVQRIKAEGDYEAAKSLFEAYGVRFDPKLRNEVVARVEKLVASHPFVAAPPGDTGCVLDLLDTHLGLGPQPKMFLRTRRRNSRMSSTGSTASSNREGGRRKDPASAWRWFARSSRCTAAASPSNPRRAREPSSTCPCP